MHIYKYFPLSDNTMITNQFFSEPLIPQKRSSTWCHRKHPLLSMDFFSFCFNVVFRIWQTEGVWVVTFDLMYEQSPAYRISFTFPASITNTTSGIVIPVSAILVAMTILRTPEGGISNAELWFSDDSTECNANILYLMDATKVMKNSF